MLWYFACCLEFGSLNLEGSTPRLSSGVLVSFEETRFG